MEPWDGPASISFTDGTVIGAVLDRNGLRPGRFWVTTDGLVVLGSEAGILDIPADKVVRKGRLQPGRMFLVDTAQGRIIEDDEIKATLAAEQPYAAWLDAGIVDLDSLPDRPHVRYPHGDVVRRQLTFGYTLEDQKILIAPMARTGVEALGSMGTDTPIAVLSERPRLLFDYFAQRFAQVTNPPLDAIREEMVTSLAGVIGPESNLLAPGPASCRQIQLPVPHPRQRPPGQAARPRRDHRSVPVGRGPRPLPGRPVEARPCARRSTTSAARSARPSPGGANIIVLSDRDSSSTMAPIPSLLLTAAVHHHLVRERTRTEVGLVIEAGDAREVHHMALLIGYGASAINPYLAFETVEDMIARGALAEVALDDAVANYIKSAGKGVLKVMSKMGISTVASYTGAQVFEAVGLGQDLVDEYFTGTPVQARWHRPRRDRRRGGRPPRQGLPRPPRRAGPPRARRRRRVPVAPRGRVPPVQPRDRVQAPARHPHRALRRVQGVHPAGRRAVHPPGHASRPVRARRRRSVTPMPLEEVEPAGEIIKRFSTGAMSYGSISIEAHENLAIAMNRLGAKSNTGEGGEDADRFSR